MITTIIFSKDRACQLDLLLRSIRQNFSGISDNIRVLCKTTTEEFAMGYDQVSVKFPEVTFVGETNFAKDTCYLLKHTQTYTCFLVDDNIIYRKPEVNYDTIHTLMHGFPNAGCFSLRLGLNTTIQDPYSLAPVAPLPEFGRLKVGEVPVVVWDWTTLPMNNFGYPFSVDGHIYHSYKILEALDFEFDTPNAFEGRFPPERILPNMFCCAQSSVVNNPINLVGSSQNKAGVWHPHSLEELNTAYLNGKQINLQTLCNNTIVGCHQEMEIAYE